MTSDELTKKLQAKAAKYCALRERAPLEVSTKLESWGAEEDQVDAILSYLKQQNFLNEERYCRAYTLDKFRFNKWGKKKIAIYLKQKGLPPNEIQEGLAQIDSTEYGLMIRDLIDQKRRSLKSAITDFEKKQKVIQYLLQKGFEYHDIEAHM